jgi:hypothetical protein
MLATPEVGIADDETWNGDRKRHASGLQLGIERGGFR